MLITIVYVHTTYISNSGFIAHYDGFLLYIVYSINKYLVTIIGYSLQGRIRSDNVVTMWWSAPFVAFF